MSLGESQKNVKYKIIAVLTFIFYMADSYLTYYMNVLAERVGYQGYGYELNPITSWQFGLVGVVPTLFIIKPLLLSFVIWFGYKYNRLLLIIVGIESLFVVANNISVISQTLNI